jgi:putative redox protein
VEVTTIYQGNMRFAFGEGVSRVVMDARPEAGGLGEALSPKQMVLQGLLGCTGLDVASMLTKKGVVFTEFTLEAKAEQTKLHPMVFKSIHIIYRMRAAEADRPTVLRAIEASKTQFCGVSAMLAKSAELTFELDLLPLG